MKYPSSLTFGPANKGGVKVERVKRSKYNSAIWAMSYLLNKDVARGCSVKIIDIGEVKKTTDILRLHFLPEIFKGFSDKFKSIELYLLRNYPKSGVGFQLQWSGFYPDFIMWIKKAGQQKLIFIDPKGLEHSKGLGDDKIIFAGTTAGTEKLVTIKKIEDELNKRAGKNIMMESFILARGSYNEFIEGGGQQPSKEQCEKSHLLFMKDDTTWPEKFFAMIL